MSGCLGRTSRQSKSSSRVCICSCKTIYYGLKGPDISKLACLPETVAVSGLLSAHADVLTRVGYPYLSPVGESSSELFQPMLLDCPGLVDHNHRNLQGSASQQPPQPQRCQAAVSKGVEPVPKPIHLKCELRDLQ